MKRDITESFRDILVEGEKLFDGTSPLSEAERISGRERIRAWRRELNEPLKIAVVGVVSSGKSTFVNALTGHDWAKEGASTVTGTICAITNHTSPEYGKPVICHFRDQSMPARRMTLDEAKGLQSDSPEALAKAQQIEYLEYAMGQEASPILADVELVDTPGINAIVDDTTSTDGKAHDRITFGFLDKADAIILVVNEYLAEKCLPLLSGYCRQCHHDMLRAASSIFIVASQVDSNQENTMAGLVRRKEQRETNILQEAMKNFGMPETTKVIGVSAKLYNELHRLGEEGFARLHQEVRSGNKKALYEAVSLPLVRLLLSAIQEEDAPRSLFRRLLTLSGIEETKKMILNEIRLRKNVLRIERLRHTVQEYFEWEVTRIGRERQEMHKREASLIERIREHVSQEPGAEKSTFGQELNDFLRRYSEEAFQEFRSRCQVVVAMLQSLSTAIDYRHMQADTYNYFYTNRAEFNAAEAEEILALCKPAAPEQDCMKPEKIQMRIGYWSMRAMRGDCRRRDFYRSLVKLYEGLRLAQLGSGNVSSS